MVYAVSKMSLSPSLQPPRILEDVRRGHDGVLAVLDRAAVGVGGKDESLHPRHGGDGRAAAHQPGECEGAAEREQRRARGDGGDAQASTGCGR